MLVGEGLGALAGQLRVTLRSLAVNVSRGVRASVSGYLPYVVGFTLLIFSCAEGLCGRTERNSA